MNSKSNYDSVQRALHRCMNILRHIRIDELDDSYEGREEFIRLSKQSKQISDNLEKSLDEIQKDLFRQFIDYKVEMYVNKGLFYYINGFEDCQALYQLFKELNEGIICIPPLDENEIIDDLTPYK